MKQKMILLLWLFGCLTMLADRPFRAHREDHFATISTPSGSIVFIGNSITNMHEWRDALNLPAILNRGISGAVSDEVVANLESYIANHPEKVFLMIGTNDLGTNGMNYPEYPFKNVRKIVHRIQKESPATEIYVQSILPSTNGRTVANITATNALLKNFCAEEGITYVDLYPLLDNGSGGLSGINSYDNLHLTAIGYNTWCRAIESYLGTSTAYPASPVNKNNGLGGAHGMRLTSFAQLPISSEDILMFGDELQHGGEWHELLGNTHVKSRGTGWGYPGPDIATMSKFVEGTLTGREGNAAPTKIFVYVGTADMNGSTAVETAAAAYKTMIENIRTLAPTTEIYIEALIPNSAPSTNSNKYAPFNEALKTIADETGAVFVDTYSPFFNGDERNEDYFFSSGKNYLNGVGYARMAEVLAPYVGDCTPISVAQASETKAINDARNQLGLLLSSLEDLRFDGTAGSYSDAAKSTLDAAAEEAYTVLQKGTAATTTELNAQIEAVNAALNSILSTIVLPKTSSEADSHWYTLCSSLRGSKYAHSNGAGNGLTGGEKTNFARMMWKFVERTDGTWDIINRADGTYISPSAAYNTQIKTVASQPETGWILKPCDTAGMFIITSGTVELNQTNLSGSPIYNWSNGNSGTDTGDTGCQLTISEAEEPAMELQTGWYRIVSTKNVAFGSYYAADALNGRYIYNSEEEYTQVSGSNTFFYPFRLQTSAEVPETKDAGYFIHIINEDGTYYVQSSNGHFLQTNCTATTAPTAISITQDDDGYKLGSTWMFFPSLDNIIGYSSNTAFAATRYHLEKVNLSDLSLAAWSISITGADAGSNIKNNVQVICATEGTTGLTKVYNEGTLFLPTDKTPTREDFRPSGEGNVETGDYKVTIDADNHNITMAIGEKDISLDEAKEQALMILSLKGIGYPKENGTARTTLENALNDAQTVSDVESAVATYVATEEVELPQAGKAYYFINCQKDTSTAFYLDNSEDGIKLVDYDGILPSSARFICRENEDGTLSFANTLGQYFVWKGTESHSDNGTNENKGYVDEYDATYCPFTLSHFAPGTYAGATDADLFGYLKICGKRMRGSSLEDVYFVVKNTGIFDQAAAPFFNDTYSSAFTVVEAENFFNIVDMTSPALSTPEGNIASVYLPFPVETGTARAFSAIIDTEREQMVLAPIEGSIIPRRTAVILFTDETESLNLIPATEEAAAPTENELLGTFEEETTSDIIFILGENEEGIGFLSSTETSLPQGKAYLAFSETPMFNFLSLFGTTGIAPVSALKTQRLYDLKGRMTTNPQHGVYIQDGRKVLR